MRIPLRRAIVSVSDKTGVEELARALDEAGCRIVSTGTTASAISEAGIPVTEVSALTGFPECLDGRVKTLHPAVHAGILADRRKASHVRQLADLGIAAFDLVVVNLYPFRQAVASGAGFEECVEKIDIGGPAMVRAAAKNHASVAVVTDPADYGAVIEAAGKGGFEDGERLRLAAKAFAHTAAYDAAVERLSAMAADLSTPVPLHAVKIGDAPTAQPVLRTPREDFERAVDEGKEAIREGEVFQVVLSQRADVECTADPFDVYRVLRTVNPSPYMYYLRLADGTGGDFSVVGSSPETLMRLTAGTLTMFPIAGSRPRGETDEADAELERELLNDPKELSEHVMLVDLGRNDLAKVCVPGTVEVTTLMEVKRYSHIMHISSTVTGRLAAGRTAVDCLAATFPAGTLSGAPKPRAIELIDELEPARRGVYGGVVGYFDLSGNADLAIAIRTAVIDSGRAHVQAGAGIVADSVPAAEFAEARNKAAAAVRAVQIANRLTAAE